LIFLYCKKNYDRNVVQKTPNDAEARKAKQKQDKFDTYVHVLNNEIMDEEEETDVIR